MFQDISLCLADEAHMINPKNQASMFTSFLKAIGNPKVIGLTATPFRNVLSYFPHENGGFEAKMALKLINRMNPRMWNRLIYNINNEELLKQGYLSPLKYVDKTFIRHEELPTNVSMTDFDLNYFERRLSERERIILHDLGEVLQTRKSVLVFCTSVSQAQRLALITRGGEVVHGKTGAEERARIINGFKDGEIPIVFNVGVLTTGFDHPQLDCIFLMRPTRSLALYYQMLGRGVRISEGKTDCLVYDYTNTVEQMGTVESIKLVKEKMWELYSGGISRHNEAIFSYRVRPRHEERALDNLLEIFRR
jgi:DNA repair protein RadD